MKLFSVDESAGLALWRQRLAYILMRAMVVLGGLPVVFAAYQAYGSRDFLSIVVYLTIYGILVAIAFSRRTSYRVQAITTMMLFGAFSFFNLLQDGLNSDNILLLFTIPLIAALFFEKRGGRWAIVAVLLVLDVVAVLFSSGLVVVYDVVPTRSADWKEWAITTTLVLALSAGLVFAQSFLLDRLNAALNQSRQLTRELEAERAGLEEQVAERTRSVERAREEAEAARRALEDQMWQVTGQAELSEVLRGEQDVATLADNVIRQVCRYLEAPVGMLFVREGDRLRPAGGYAHAAAVDAFRLGEGVVGQAALEGQSTVVADIPEGHLRVASGVGDVVPRHVLVVPFAYEGTVTGVVEVGALRPFTERQRAFASSVMESVAIAFNTVRTRVRMEELLVEMQQQAEELQAQEEELRAANEELEAQMESLRASEARLREKQEDLEALNAELEAERAARRQT